MPTPAEAQYGSSTVDGYNDDSAIQTKIGVDSNPPQELPFTGADISLLGLAGFALLAAGYAIKRKLHPVPPYAG